MGDSDGSENVGPAIPKIPASESIARLFYNPSRFSLLGNPMTLFGSDVYRGILERNSAIVALSRKLTAPIADSLISHMAFTNQIPTSFLQATQLKLGTQLAESIGSKSIANAMISNSAINILADHMVAQSRLVPKDYVLASQFSAISKSTHVLSEWAQLNTRGLANFSTSLSSLTALRKYANKISTNPTSYQLNTAVLGSIATRSFVEIDLLESCKGSDEVGEAVDLVEVDLVDISNQERIATAGMLMKLLTDLDPTIAELLRGAWEELALPRAAAVSKIANCAVEAIDRTFRAAAPDDVALPWVNEHQDLKRSLNDGKLTRALRAAYVFRQRPSERRLLLAEERNFATSTRLIHSNLESAKHGDSVDLNQVRSLLIAAESLLTQLLM